jgi:hypothetical protein
VRIVTRLAIAMFGALFVACSSTSKNPSATGGAPNGGTGALAGAAGWPGGGSGGSGGAVDGASGSGGGGPNPAYRRVLVTKELFPGNFGGPDQADVECQDIADARSLGGKWMAWVSTSTKTAGARFEAHPVPYVLLAKDGIGDEIADDWNHLIDGSLDTAISINEDGEPTASGCAWTGTTVNGLSSPPDCNGWTEQSQEGRWGSPKKANAEWTESAIPAKCNGSACSFYCFEQ